MAAGGEAGKSATNRNCGFCIRAVKYLPVVFLSVVIGWSYYAYTIQLCFRTVISNFEKGFYLVGYHISLLIFLWSYWQTIATKSAKVPPHFKLPYSELEKLEAAKNEQAQRQILENFASTLPVTNRTVNGSIRFCEKCQHIKPDRAHHCSVCGTCILKMDHHCPWVNNCVSFTNYKFFILFLGYALIYCLFITCTSLQYCIKFWQGENRDMGRFNIVFLFFAAVMFSVSLLSLFCYHCYLISHNRTTLEAFRAPLFLAGPDKNGFSLGAYNNFQEIFGANCKTWFLPVFTRDFETQYSTTCLKFSFSCLLCLLLGFFNCFRFCLGDGITFPVRSCHRANYNSMGNTESSNQALIFIAVVIQAFVYIACLLHSCLIICIGLGDGINYPRRAVSEDCHYLLSEDNWEEESDTQTVLDNSATPMVLTDPAPV